MKNYFFKFPKFIFKATLSHIFMFAAIVIYEGNLKKNLNYIFKGVIDGVAGKYGKLDER